MSNTENIEHNSSYTNKYEQLLEINRIKDIDTFLRTSPTEHPIFFPFLNKENVESLNKIEDIEKVFNDIPMELVMGIYKSALYHNKKYTYHNTIKSNKFECGDVPFGEKLLGISSVKVKNKDNSNNAVMLMSKAFGIGDILNIPLWNSGFWVTLKPVTSSELISLEIALTKTSVELGRDTLGLIYSNANVIYSDILSKFIVDHIVNTSLDIPSNDDIRNYINIHDYYTLILGCLSSIYPTGLNLNIACSNIIKNNDVKENTKNENIHDEDDEDIVVDINMKGRCKYVAKIKVDTKKLLWVNRDKISNKMLDIISNRKPKSVSVDTTLEYQRLLKEELNYNNEIKVRINNGSDMIIGLKTPTIMEYIEHGSKWVNDIIKQFEKLLVKTDSNEENSSKLNALISSKMLGVYSPFISYIKGNEDIVLDTYDAISNFISLMDSTVLDYNSFIDSITKFIENSTVSIVATPDFVCPTCNEYQCNSKSNNPDFQELIPINMLYFFFVLNAMKRIQIEASMV